MFRAEAPAAAMAAAAATFSWFPPSIETRSSNSVLIPSTRRNAAGMERAAIAQAPKATRSISRCPSARWSTTNRPASGCTISRRPMSVSWWRAAAAAARATRVLPPPRTRRPAGALVEGWVVACRHPARPGEILYFFTTLDLKPRRILALYKLRWNIETDLRSLKRTVGLHQLTSKTRPMVEKEVLMAVSAYNLVRTVI